MPFIPSDYIDSVVYLYPSKDDAARGEHEGGTGFLVGVPSETNPNDHHLYVVTAAHVFRQGARTARINTSDGEADAIALDESDCFFHYDGTDVAIARVDLDPDFFKLSFIAESNFLSQEALLEHGFGPGDETFFIGRFRQHEGRVRNLPTVRFGNLARLAEQPVPHESGVSQESFLVESRSLSGYSGSPVFVYRWSYIDEKGHIQYLIESKCFLLGVDWCHFGEMKRVLDEGRNPLGDRWYVEQNSGMMGVIPAWKVTEILHTEEVAKTRRTNGSHSPEGEPDV